MWLYVNFENGFVYWENFEDRHPEKVKKISETCKENVCGRVLLYSDYFFSVHGNFISQYFGRKTNEQQAKSNEEQAKNNEQKVMSNKQAIKSNEQQARRKK